MTTAIENINFIPFKKIVRASDSYRKPFSFYLNAAVKIMAIEMSLPENKKDFPLDEWVMPDEPEGYIRCRDIDLL